MTYMTEQREVSRLDLYIAHGMRDTAARAIATLIRSARTTRSETELRASARVCANFHANLRKF